MFPNIYLTSAQHPRKICYLEGLEGNVKVYEFYLFSGYIAHASYGDVQDANVVRMVLTAKWKAIGIEPPLYGLVHDACERLAIMEGRWKLLIYKQAGN